MDRLRPRPHGDDGISLIETVVAMLVFVVFATSAAAFLINTLKVDKTNTQRVTAANLAASQIELVRASTALSLTDGTTTVTPTALNGTTYTVTQTVRFVANASGDAVCAGTSGTLAYKLVTVSVSWPGMGKVAPVRADTLRALGLGTDQNDTRKGTGAIGLTDAAGAAVPGATVALSNGSSYVTGSDGCAVFPNLTTGSYTYTVTATGYVGRQGEAVLTGSFSVTAATVTRLALNYAPKGAVAVTLTAPSGYTWPATLPVTLDSSLLTPTTTRLFPDCSTVSTSPQSCVTGTPRTASALYPGAYTGWAGTCADAKPASPPSAAVTAGGTASLTAALGALQVTLTTGTTATVYAWHRASAGSCTTGVLWPMVLVTNTSRKLALPPGTWDVTKNSDGTLPIYTNAVVTAGGTTSVTA